MRRGLAILTLALHAACGGDERPVAIAPADPTMVANTSVDLILDGKVPGEKKAALTALVRQSTEHGKLDPKEGPAPLTVTYTPFLDFLGSDFFTFSVKSKTGGESLAVTVTITVVPPNNPPTADGQLVQTAHETPVEITLTGSDPDGDALHFEVTYGPHHGSVGAVTGVGPESATVTYTPEGGFTGADSFRFTVSDDEATSDPAVVVVQVQSP